MLLQYTFNLLSYHNVFYLRTEAIYRYNIIYTYIQPCGSKNAYIGLPIYVYILLYIYACE